MTSEKGGENMNVNENFMRLPSLLSNHAQTRMIILIIDVTTWKEVRKEDQKGMRKHG